MLADPPLQGEGQARDLLHADDFKPKTSSCEPSIHTGLPASAIAFMRPDAQRFLRPDWRGRKYWDGAPTPDWVEHPLDWTPEAQAEAARERASSPETTKHMIAEIRRDLLDLRLWSPGRDVISPGAGSCAPINANTRPTSRACLPAILMADSGRARVAQAVMTRACFRM
jgi:hypothetical protein